MKQFTIYRHKWLRGEGGALSYLLRPRDGKMCCIGFYAKQTLDIPEGALTKVKDLERACPTDWDAMPDLDRKVINDLYEVNDDPALTEKTRERTIVSAFKALNVLVHFE